MPKYTEKPQGRRRRGTGGKQEIRSRTQQEGNRRDTRGLGHAKGEKARGVQEYIYDGQQTPNPPFFLVTLRRYIS